MKNKIFVISLLVLFSSTLSSLAKTQTLQEIKEVSGQNSQQVSTNKVLNDDHWVYKTLEEITKKYGLLMGNPEEKFKEKNILSRDEAAFILVNLIGKIEKDQFKLNEVEKTKMDILKQELHDEITQLTSRVTKIETAVETLKGGVAKVEEENKKAWKFDYGEKLKITGGIQSQFTGSIQKGEDSYPSNFALPYSEIRFSGQVNPKVGYAAALIPTRMFDGSEKGILREAYTSLNIIPHHTIYLGQTMVPIGYEGPQNPLAIETIDKAQMSRKITDMPDLGIKTEGNWNYIDYSFGAYNGNGQNIADTNSDLALASWIKLKPLYKYPKFGSVELGGGYYTGNNGNNDRNIMSFYSGYKYKKLALWGEYLKADGYENNNQKADSFYIHSSYYLTDKLQLIARYDQFDPNTEIKKDTNREYTIGGNYLLKENLSLMLGLVQVASQSGENSHRIEALTQFLF